MSAKGLYRVSKLLDGDEARKYVREDDRGWNVPKPGYEIEVIEQPDWVVKAERLDGPRGDDVPHARVRGGRRLPAHVPGEAPRPVGRARRAVARRGRRRRGADRRAEEVSALDQGRDAAATMLNPPPPPTPPAAPPKEETVEVKLRAPRRSGTSSSPRKPTPSPRSPTPGRRPSARLDR